MKSFFGTLWRDIQIGVRLLTPFEGAIAVMPGGSIVVTVLNILTLLNKVIPNSTDSSKAALAAALTVPNHPTVDPVKLQATILELLNSIVPIGTNGLHAIALVEQTSATAPGPAKKAAVLTLISEITQGTTGTGPEVSTSIDNAVTGLNKLGDLANSAQPKVQ